MPFDKGVAGQGGLATLTSDKELILNNENCGKSNIPNNLVSVAKRPVINQATFNEVYQLSRPQPKGALSSVAHATRSRCSKCCHSKQFLWDQMKKRFPVLEWLPKYDFRNNLVSDMAGGLTVGILHIPQGMAYALLANVPPVVGLYVSFFPVLIYFLMGSSLHLSVGSSTIVSLMVGKIINQKVRLYYEQGVDGFGSLLDMDDDDDDDDDDRFFNATNFTDTDIDAFKIKVAVTACFLVGAIQCAMGILQLGTLSVYLSDMLISGFTTGAAVQSLTSQLKYLLGVSIASREGPLTLVYTYVDLLSNITKVNIATCTISAVTIVCLVAVNEGINARFRHKLKVPVPIELIVIIVGTLVSYFCDFNEEYDVRIVNNIPTGIPSPKLPQFYMMKGMIPDALAIAVVVFSLSVSVSKLLARNHKYDINPTQELLAFGTSNLVAAFFSCFPCCASISRSLVQKVAGGKTQLSSLASCLLLLIVLLVIAPLFATLPNCVLAAIIVVALKGMFKQVMDFKDALQVSKLDAATWAVTFLSTCLVDIEIGLGVGIMFSLLTILIRTKRPRVFSMGNVPYTDVYLDVKKFKTAKEIEGVKVLHFSGALYFANKDHFRNDIQRKTFNNPNLHLSNQKKKKEKNLEAKNGKAYITDDKPGQPSVQRSDSTVTLNNNLYLTNKNNHLRTVNIVPLLREIGSTTSVHTVVIDCSAISFIDASGLNVVQQVSKTFQELNIRFFLADCQDNVIEKLEKSEFYENENGNIFPTIHDAVVYAIFGDGCTPAKQELNEAPTHPVQMPSPVPIPSAPPVPISTAIPTADEQSLKNNQDSKEVNEENLEHAHAYINMSFVEHL
ncbi:hypothetical protein CHUAL_005505 [Chamberlinius hualienensis]